MEKTDRVTVAMLIWAHGSDTPAETEEPNELEDYACLMHAKIVEWNLPTWVIGDPDEIEPDVGYAWVLEIWPQCKEPRKTRSTDLNAVLDKLQTTHCK